MPTLGPLMRLGKRDVECGHERRDPSSSQELFNDYHLAIPGWSPEMGVDQTSLQDCRGSKSPLFSVHVSDQLFLLVRSVVA